MFGHVARCIVDESDQCSRGCRVSRIIILRRLRRDQYFDLGALLQLKRFLWLEDAVLVDGLDRNRHGASSIEQPADQHAPQLWHGPTHVAAVEKTCLPPSMPAF